MNTMTQNRFEDLAAAYGARIALWPADERASAEALLATSTEAQDLLAAEAALDAVLDGWEAPAPSDALMARILGDAADMSVTQQAAPVAVDVETPGLLNRLFGDLFSGWRPAGAMAACLAIGFVAGMSDPLSTTQDMVQGAQLTSDDAVLAAFFGDSESEGDLFDLEVL